MLEVLEKIGNQLDRNIFPSVKNGGIVVPNTNSDHSTTLGSGQHNERQRKRQTAPQWQELTRWWWDPQWQWATQWRRSPYTAPSVLSAGLKQKCEKDLILLSQAYPDTRSWREETGLWVLTESALLPASLRKAIFLVGISFRWPFIVRGWGFWVDEFSGIPLWIGPRHTNFTDGSICAFEPSDETWTLRDPIVGLLDIYTLWAVRHLHLEFLGRWPGYQVAHHPYERILEIREDEYCGCGGSEQYKNCCQPRDLRRNRLTDAIDFRLMTGGCERKPPSVISEFICGGKKPPCLDELLIVS